jgi:hypothetical protein
VALYDSADLKQIDGMWNIEGKQVSSVMVSGDYTNACMLV